jgi:hypothetical protein
MGPPCVEDPIRRSGSAECKGANGRAASYKLGAHETCGKKSKKKQRGQPVTMRRETPHCRAPSVPPVTTAVTSATKSKVSAGRPKNASGSIPAAFERLRATQVVNNAVVAWVKKSTTAFSQPISVNLHMDWTTNSVATAAGGIAQGSQRKIITVPPRAPMAAMASAGRKLREKEPPKVKTRASSRSCHSNGLP